MTENGKTNRGKKKTMVKIVVAIVVARRPPNGDQVQRRPLVPSKIENYIMLTLPFMS